MIKNLLSVYFTSQHVIVFKFIVNLHVSSHLLYDL